jgi:hypothetical protein
MGGKSVAEVAHEAHVEVGQLESVVQAVYSHSRCAEIFCNKALRCDGGPEMGQVCAVFRCLRKKLAMESKRKVGAN